jgi:hypothetical protein
MSGYPPLPSDVMPDDLVDNENSPGYANQGYSRSEHAGHLRTALAHCEASVRCLGKAIDALQFDPYVDANPEGEKAGRGRAATLDIAKRTLKFAIASNI